MARAARCEVIAADVGILNFPGCSGVLDRRVQNGTGDITQGPAMSREACVRAVLAGAELAREVSRRTGIPLVCHMVRRELISRLPPMDEPVFPITLYMKKPWE